MEKKKAWEKKVEKQYCARRDETRQDNGKDKQNYEGYCIVSKEKWNKKRLGK